MNVHWLFFQPFLFFQVFFLFFKFSDWSAMFCQYIKLSKIRYKQKAFFSKITDEKMQLRSFLVWLSRDDTELVVSVSTVDFVYMFVFYTGSN